MVEAKQNGSLAVVLQDGFRSKVTGYAWLTLKGFYTSKLFSMPYHESYSESQRARAHRSPKAVSPYVININTHKSNGKHLDH